MKNIFKFLFFPLTIYCCLKYLITNNPSIFVVIGYWTFCGPYILCNRKSQYLNLALQRGHLKT